MNSIQVSEFMDAINYMDIEQLKEEVKQIEHNCTHKYMELCDICILISEAESKKELIGLVDDILKGDL